MSGDETLAALISREQRGFRRILFAGTLMIAAMVVASVASSYYLFTLSQRIVETTSQLEDRAFKTRLLVDQQNNRVSEQEQSIRRVYDEIRLNIDESALDESGESADLARQAAADFLLRGRRLSVLEERTMRRLGRSANGTIDAATKALFEGVSFLSEYDSKGLQPEAGAPGLPRLLVEARSAFERARAGAGPAALAEAGLGWILFEDASSGRNNYSRAACEAVFSAVNAMGRGEPMPQPLYWQAQCERKLGLTDDAAGHYARALMATVPDGGDVGRDPDDDLMAMNAYHGVGTTLITAADLPDTSPGLREATQIAQAHCPAPPDSGASSPRMRLAVACLDMAIALRRKLGQTDNQVSGSQENMGFAHLRNRDFDAAYRNAAEVETTGLFAWNELVRALASERVAYPEAGRQEEANAANVSARRNLSRFDQSAFNLCELRALFDPEMYDAARAIIAETHGGEEPACETA